MPDNLRAWLPDPTADDAYPIVTYTWLMCYKKYDDPENRQTLKDVIQYGLDRRAEAKHRALVTFRFRPMSSMR